MATMTPKAPASFSVAQKQRAIEVCARAVEESFASGLTVLPQAQASMTKALKEHRFGEALEHAKTGTCPAKSPSCQHVMQRLFHGSWAANSHACLPSIAAVSLDPNNAMLKEFVRLLEEKQDLGELGGVCTHLRVAVRCHGHSFAAHGLHCKSLCGNFYRTTGRS